MGFIIHNVWVFLDVLFGVFKNVDFVMISERVYDMVEVCALALKVLGRDYDSTHVV